MFHRPPKKVLRPAATMAAMMIALAVLSVGMAQTVEKGIGAEIRVGVDPLTFSALAQSLISS
jgi:hypothetical protein